MIKVSFLGDIMCEPCLLKAAKRADTYVFSGVFEHVVDLLKESDYVIGNLETPLAGKKAKYVHGLFSFNAPDEFANAVKMAGIDFVSTANNHCMDRDINGLKRTVEALDRIGLSHDGTRSDPEESNLPFVVSIDNTRIALVPFTYGTNYRIHHHELPNKNYVNLLHSDTDPTFSPQKKSVVNRLNSILLKPLKKEQIIAIKKALGMQYYRPIKDDYLDEERVYHYFENLGVMINKAKDLADVVIFLPHIGGQFNEEPGRFTEYTVKKALQFGADAIVASHPHVVQKAEWKNGVPCYYSIGNFSMSPNSVYLLHENLPDYGLAVHLYIEEKKIVRTTFTILKIVEPKGKMLTIYPADEYLDQIEDTAAREKTRKDIGQIYTAVTQKNFDGIVKQEYVLD